MVSRLFVTVFLVLLAGCANDSRPQALHPLVNQDIVGRPMTVQVATTRGREQGTLDFDYQRSKSLHFQTITLSIPPNHKPGEIEWPQQFPGEASRNFVTLRNEMIAQQAFIARVEQQLPPTGEVFVFIHGYNTHHEEAIFRLGQMMFDSKNRSAPIAFTWASRGDITDYVTDRESSLAARSRLYELLTLLSRSPKVKHINLFSHSMGGMLMMETLLQAKLRGNGEFGGKLDAIVLASPDIDVDVFMSQFEVIGKRPRPTIILTSRNDRALELSRRIAGNVVRVGAASIRDPVSVAAIKTYGFTVIDMTGMQTNDPTNHVKFASSPLFLQQMGRYLNAGLTQQGSPVGAFIANTAGVVLDAPANVLRRVAR